MAKELKEFPADGRGRTARYDWETWLNGKVWQLEAGADFTSKAGSMRTLIYSHARKAGGTARIQIQEGGKIVVVQFVPKKSE